MINLQNTYASLPDRFYEKNRPATFPAPELIKFNDELARDLGMDVSDLSPERLAAIFSGQEILPTSVPLSIAYAGFQFGHPVPQLGDGRAHLLGEIAGHDIQLKGSGRTRFSRGGDGRSALGPVLREYIVSEALHALGVPTTRALAAVLTGEAVERQDGMEPGGVFTRVAKSHIRVGTFQYFAFQKDLEALEILLNFTIERHYPDLSSLASLREKSLALIKRLTELQSDLIAQWSALGFIHGVMNTDNFSLGGFTIDLGPCAFMDEFSFDKVFSSIDRNGRYSFFNQTEIAKWNIVRFAECLLPLINPDPEKAIPEVQELLEKNFDQFDIKRMKAFAWKLGIRDYESSDETIVMDFLKYLESEKLDFTQSFRRFSELPASPVLESVLARLKNRGVDFTGLDDVNPFIIPRNHQIAKAIKDAYAGDFTHFHKMVEAIRNPYKELKEFQEFSLPPKPEERVQQTFCGT